MRLRGWVLLMGSWLAAEGRAQRQAGPTVPPGKQATAGSATETAPTLRREGWSYDPNAGMVLERGDFKWTVWGYGEHVFRVKGDGFWRRVRQGMEFDLPRSTPHVRSSLVYEVDFTDTNFFRDAAKFNIAENLYWAVQDADDPGKGRVLFGENTHILSREDNLSSGNLPTINRSLTLEEHGGVHSFGTQFGVEAFKRLSPRSSIAFSALDNRGSLNTPNPRYVVGNSVAVKWTAQLWNQAKRGRSLSVGAGVDHTRDIREGKWTFLTAVAGQAIGSAPAAGNELSVEGEAVYTDRLRGHAYTVESEQIVSQFSKSRTLVPGGYVLGQYSVFDTLRWGDLDPFVRYDWVHLSTPTIASGITQQALRAGFNWNLPEAHRLVCFHLEYGRNRVRGPLREIPAGAPQNELGLELRFNAARYFRH